MTRRTGHEGLHTRVVRDRRDAETLRAVAAEIREARQSPKRCGDPLCDFEDCGLEGPPGWAGLSAEREAPATPDPLDRWPAFAEQVRRRLEAGRAAYGDRSFSRSPDALFGELQQEALDLAGWGFVLFERIAAAREALRRGCDCQRCDPVDGAPVPCERKGPR